MSVATPIGPTDRALDADGRDWSWAFVVFREHPRAPGKRFGSDGSVWKWLPSRGRWKRLKCGTDSAGYPFVSLASAGDRLHVLMLEAFVGPRPPGMYGCHRDDDKANNALRNLYWGTPSQNSRDAIANGKAPLGSRKRNSKLSDDDVREIKRLRSEGVSQSAVAARFGVSRSRIEYIDLGKNWSHIPGEPPREAERPLRRYSEAEIETMVRLRAEGVTYAAIGDRFGVTRGCVAGLIRQAELRQVRRAAAR